MEKKWIVVGLGNPGPKYETTRHNVGFLAIDRMVDRWNASGPVSKFEGELYQCSVNGQSVVLVKPKTFMNLSGKCVGPLFGFYHCRPENLIVIHDELDLPPLTLRLKTGGGTGGHNGLKSIDQHLGKDHLKYHRFRIGVGHPMRLPGENGETLSLRISPADYVLQPFSDAELKGLDPLLDQVAEAFEETMRNGIQSAMNQFHRHQ